MPLPSSCRVLVLPEAQVPASPDHQSLALPLADALRGPWGSRFGMQAHFTGYAPRQGDRGHRLLKAGLEVAEAEGYELTTWFVDIDRPNHQRWPGKRQAVDALESVLERADAAGFPSGGYITGGGIRLVVALHPPVPLAKARSTLQALFRRLRETVEVADVGLGWQDESTDQWTRVFKAPDAIDPKTGEPTEVYLVVPERTLNASSLAAEAETERPTVPIHAPGERVDQDPTSWEDWWYLVRPTTKAGLVKHYLRDGEVLPFEEGERNKALLGVVRSLSSQLAHRYPGPDALATAIYSICLPSVLADQREGSPTVDELWSMCSRSSPLDAVDPARAMEVPQGPLLVAHAGGQHYWVQKPKGGWDGPYSGGVVAIKFRDHYPEMPQASDTGNPWSASRLAYAYGATIKEAVYGHQGGGYDHERGVLKLRLYVDRPEIPAVRHDDVAEWLALLAGDCPHLINWLSWYTALEHPLPALVLYGDHGAGKTMLLSALAQFWGGTSTDWKKVLTDNHALGPLLRSPMIRGDDVDGGFENERQTGIFREITANSFHQVNEKHMPNVTIGTSARVVVTTNDRSVLSIRGRHSAISIEAVRRRCLGVTVGSGARDYLEALGGRAGTLDWVPPGGDPGKVAEHIAWLQTQRPVEWSGRLPVEAWISEELSDGAITGRHDDMEVWLSVIQAVLKDARSIAHIDEPGTVWVSSKGVFEGWVGLGRPLDTRPSWPAANSTIANASPATTSVRKYAEKGGRQIRFWPVPSKYLVKVAADIGHDEYERVLHLHECGNMVALSTEAGERGAL